MAVSDAGNELFTGGIDNDIKVELKFHIFYFTTYIGRLRENRFGIFGNEPLYTSFEGTKTLSHLLPYLLMDNLCFPTRWIIQSEFGILGHLHQQIAYCIRLPRACKLGLRRTLSVLVGRPLGIRLLLAAVIGQ